MGHGPQTPPALPRRVPQPGATSFENKEILRAAVRLLDSAYFSDGPTTSGTYDMEEMARRLGPALEGVREVERVLVE